MKKEQSFGDLFKSFAKAKPKAPEAEKPKPQDGQSYSQSTEFSTNSTTDEMQGMSEDEGDDDDEPAIKFDEAKAAAAKQAREERERKLREMMEADGTLNHLQRTMNLADHSQSKCPTLQQKKKNLQLRLWKKKHLPRQRARPLLWKAAAGAESAVS